MQQTRKGATDEEYHPPHACPLAEPPQGPVHTKSCSQGVHLCASAVCVASKVLACRRSAVREYYCSEPIFKCRTKNPVHIRNDALPPSSPPQKSAAPPARRPKIVRRCPRLDGSQDRASGQEPVLGLARSLSAGALRVPRFHVVRVPVLLSLALALALVSIAPGFPDYFARASTSSWPTLFSSCRSPSLMQIHRYPSGFSLCHFHVSVKEKGWGRGGQMRLSCMSELSCMCVCVGDQAGLFF